MNNVDNSQQDRINLLLVKSSDIRKDCPGIIRDMNPLREKFGIEYKVVDSVSGADYELQYNDYKGVIIYHLTTGIQGIDWERGCCPWLALEPTFQIIEHAKERGLPVIVRWTYQSSMVTKKWVGSYFSKYKVDKVVDPDAGESLEKACQELFISV